MWRVGGQGHETVGKQIKRGINDALHAAARLGCLLVIGGEKDGILEAGSCGAKSTTEFVGSKQRRGGKIRNDRLE